MTLTVQCPHCQHQFQLSSTLTWKRVRCRSCGRHFTAEPSFTVAAAPLTFDIDPLEDQSFFSEPEPTAVEDAPLAGTPRATRAVDEPAASAEVFAPAGAAARSPGSGASLMAFWNRVRDGTFPIVIIAVFFLVPLVGSLYHLRNEARAGLLFAFIATDVVLTLAVIIPAVTLGMFIASQVAHFELAGRAPLRAFAAYCIVGPLIVVTILCYPVPRSSGMNPLQVDAFTVAVILGIVVAVVAVYGMLIATFRLSPLKALVALLIATFLYLVAAAIKFIVAGFAVLVIVALSAQWFGEKAEQERAPPITFKNATEAGGINLLLAYRWIIDTIGQPGARPAEPAPGVRPFGVPRPPGMNNPQRGPKR